MRGKAVALLLEDEYWEFIELLKTMAGVSREDEVIKILIDAWARQFEHLIFDKVTPSELARHILFMWRKNYYLRRVRQK